jgi:hypothetical protein
MGRASEPKRFLRPNTGGDWISGSERWKEGSLSTSLNRRKQEEEKMKERLRLTWLREMEGRISAEPGRGLKDEG